MNKQTLEEQLSNLNKYVGEYHRCNLQDGETLNRLLQKIGGTLFYLTTVRAEVHDLFENKLQELVESGMSVARAQNETNIRYPEMYRLRRTLEASERIHTAISVHISYLKAEMRNL